MRRKSQHFSRVADGLVYLVYTDGGASLSPEYLYRIEGIELHLIRWIAIRGRMKGLTILVNHGELLSPFEKEIYDTHRNLVNPGSWGSRTKNYRRRRKYKSRLINMDN